jgi:hypothetical protein
MLSRLLCGIWGHAVQNEVYERGERSGRSASTRAAPAATRFCSRAPKDAAQFPTIDW